MHRLPDRPRAARLAGALVLGAAALIGAAALVDTVAASPPAIRETVIDSSTVVIIATPEEVTVAIGAPLRVGPAQHTAELKPVLAGSADQVREEIITAIDQARGDLGADAASTAFLIAHLGSGCVVAEAATVVRPASSGSRGDVTVVGAFPAAADDVNCLVAIHSIAIVAVDTADVPIGGADQAELIAFVPLHERSSTEVLATLRLAAPRAGHLQLAIEFSGCQDRAAELVITTDRIHAVGNQGDDTPGPLCVRAEHFLAVFELPEHLIPHGAVIDGLVASYGSAPNTTG